MEKTLESISLIFVFIFMLCMGIYGSGLIMLPLLNFFSREVALFYGEISAWSYLVGVCFGVVAVLLAMFKDNLYSSC